MSYLEAGMIANCPDDDCRQIQAIEIGFAIPVLMTQEQQRNLVAIADDIIDSPWNQPKEGVHWLAGTGSKPNWSQADSVFLGKYPDANAPASGEPTFDDTVFTIESCARGFASEKERERKEKGRAKPYIPRRVLEDEVAKLRKILAFVPSDVAIKAKEAAGYGTRIRPQETTK